MPADVSNYNDISQRARLTGLWRSAIFFEIYKDLEPSPRKVFRRIDAYRAIRAALALYQRHRREPLQGEYPEI